MKPIWKYVLIVVLNAAISAGFAFLAFKRSAELPVAPQVGLVDVDAVVNSIRPEDPGSKERARMKIVALKEQAKRLAAAGVIVIDSKYVIDAPDEAYIGDKPQTSNKEK